MQGLHGQPQLQSTWPLNPAEWNHLWAALVTALVLVLPIFDVRSSHLTLRLPG